jgi:hypothetical protein
VYVERESQKPIVIGRGGAGIRELGRRSREKIEAFIGARVYLDLFVKTLPNWRAKLSTLRYLGYRLPPSMEHEDAHEDERGSPRSGQPRASGVSGAGESDGPSRGRKGKRSRGSPAGKSGKRPRGAPKRGE